MVCVVFVVPVVVILALLAIPVGVADVDSARVASTGGQGAFMENPGGVGVAFHGGAPLQLCSRIAGDGSQRSGLHGRRLPLALEGLGQVGAEHLHFLGEHFQRLHLADVALGLLRERLIACDVEVLQALHVVTADSLLLLRD